MMAIVTAEMGREYFFVISTTKPSLMITLLVSSRYDIQLTAHAQIWERRKATTP